MLKLYPLFSGSSGNMYFIQTSKSKILIDFGVSYRAGKTALKNINIDVQDIDAIFITHEHVDHVKGLALFIKSNPSCILYATKKTYNKLNEKYFYSENIIPNYIEVKYNNKICTKDLEIMPIKVSHDAVMPTAYTITSEDKTITIATDLGYIDDNIYYSLKNSDLSVLESNYDPNLLLYGPYPYGIKLRISGNQGHLSNLDTSSAILRLAADGRRNFVLGHISKNNNTEDLALNEVKTTLKNNGFNLEDFSIHVATHEASDEVYVL